MPRSLAVLSAVAVLAAAHLSPAVAGSSAKRKLFSVPGVISAYAETFCGPGTVAGTATTNSWVSAAFTDDVDGNVTTWSVPGSTYTSAHACYQGRFLGDTVVGGVRQGFAVMADGSVQLVAPADGTFASVSGANATGTLVGSYFPADKGGSRASGFLWQDGVFTRYDVENYTVTQLVQITEDGTLVGNYQRGIPLRSTGFIDRHGVRQDIAFPGAYDTTVTGMNAAGQVVGYFDSAIGADHKGFVWADGRFKTFSMTATGNTWALGIDDQSRVVGYYIDTSDYSSRNFILVPRP